MKGKIISSSIFSIALILMAVYIGEFNSYLYAFIGCAGMWGMTHVSLANEKLKVENEALKSENATLIQQQQKSLDEINTIRQKYSRTNQPRSGGKFVKGENFISKVGDRFKCNRDFIMNEGWAAFTSGRTYLCEVDGCLTDNQGYYMHGMGEDNIKLYFTRVNP